MGELVGPVVSPLVSESPVLVPDPSAPPDVPEPLVDVPEPLVDVPEPLVEPELPPLS
ncbi:MAG: hypothetical protein WAR60_00370 [Candidatus Microthrix parvicella]|nr:hypothetical protein [Candidatus Microthrix sp.]MBP9834742.1 hypothetical protein [Candidatus Microthrix sp.]